MRAVEVTEYGDSSVLTITDRPAPTPSEGEVSIDVAAVGVNFADIEQRRGNYPDSPSPPFVPGLEVAGTVRTAPAGSDLVVGDRVAALTSSGGYAERATAPAEQTFRIPESLSWAAATALPVQGLTAHNVLHEWGNLSSGERVLVHAGAGGVGSLAVQFADAAGATVLATASTAEKRELTRDLGADHAIDYTDVDVADAVLSRTEGVDLVVDGVGGNAFAASVEALAPVGRIVTFGMASGSVPTVATPRLFFANQSVIGYHLEHALDHVPERVLEAVPSVIDHLASGQVEVVVDRTVPLSEPQQAHDALANRETVGKVVLTP
ncbi:NADPH:quinone oxidoreductase family protein [Halogeometricum borinquense]|uniref:NADPH:quinone oxidoreductase family protein n=1 Tax=Halogeometricum borinquense TaxID=60847 RepID=A0A6C0UIK6_9EURY|nr:NADPH:quinone oxidoreductase family protein [Halogeometricum borinquense]QIB75037.1 NADPH:quinone oxidoreductase family protein [Halogeometricum borinquense]QIQ75982.1 NADPH:quinone oxidoreductase family protein [Halogeometricum borinquense]